LNVGYWLRHPLVFARRLWHYTYERTHPHEPFLAPSAVRFLDEALPRDGRGLEWGSGRSTRWLAQRLGHLTAVEHDPRWRDAIMAQLKAARIDNVDYRVVPLEHPEHEPTRPHYDPLPRYVAFVEEFPDRSFDFVEVDGHYRQACVTAAIPKLKPGGLLLVDDTNWIPKQDWGVPPAWPIVHESVKINTVTSIWRRPCFSESSPRS
jgi:SAM-dependent methyltransferase